MAEFISAICTANSIPNPIRYRRSPGAMRRLTPRATPHRLTVTTPSAIRQKALQNGGITSSPIFTETRLPPHKMEINVASKAPDQPIGLGEDKRLF